MKLLQNYSDISAPEDPYEDIDNPENAGSESESDDMGPSSMNFPSSTGPQTAELGLAQPKFHSVKMQFDSQLTL